MNDRRGFTLVELIIVALLGSLLVMTAYQVLITNQQTYRVQNSRMQVQQSTRAAMDVLFSELREVSSRGADIVTFEPDHMEFRAMRTVGAVCDVDLSQLNILPTMTVRKVLDDFQAGDSVFVFADNDPFITGDDAWIKARISGVDTTAVCTDLDGVEYEATRMAFTGQAAAFVADTVRDGAPMREFTRYSYGLMDYDGETYLGRSQDGGDWSPLVGPLTGATGKPGLEFAYLDADGNAATTTADIAQVRVMVRSHSRAVDQKGDPVVDSLNASIYLRN
ncbi:MAG: prepilin-type N-terminal cleavage/methylation domain-containing protein [Gemmatimonadota bacterium]|jgi:prepilin-type N-terminal cleavage/methylation domain-containing protein